MWQRARSVLGGGAGDLVRVWGSVAATGIIYKAVSIALLAPGIALFLRWLLSRTGTQVVADADIARFFVTTRAGVVALVLGGALIAAVTAVELACMMAIGLAAAEGRRLSARRALTFGATHSVAVLRLVAHMVLRVVLGLLPFIALGGLVYATLLRSYDINYYLAKKPPAFWAAAALVAVIAIGLAALLVGTITRWALALPLVLFERVHPARALGASAKLSTGRRSLIAVVLLAWATIALGLTFGARALLDVAGRAIAPHAAGSLPLLLAVVALLVLLWALFAVAVSVVQSALFALLVVRIYREARPSDGSMDPPTIAGTVLGGDAKQLPARAVAAFAVVALLGVVGISLLALVVTRAQREVVVIAHRGASAEAPENSLSSFRLAADEHADFIELDVQETADGEVVVVHDSDLMKVAGVPGKIWEKTLAELRAIDIGSRFDSRFAGERVPILAEVFEAMKGRTHIVVELKSYGHDQRLVERVVALVEAAGMEKDCIFMSLDHRMVADMKRLRPQWRVGVLAAKALGDITTLDADFLAVEARMIDVRFVWRAHRAGKAVYAWTVNDPAWMLRVMGRGADGLITDKPALGLEVVARRAQMSDAERLLVSLLIRLGARTETLESMDALRP